MAMDSPNLKRLYPRAIQDKELLSAMLDKYLCAFEDILHVNISDLSYCTRIPEKVILRLRNLRNCPEDAENLVPEDFHTVFSNITIRYPTLKIWQQSSGEIFIEM